MCFEIYWACFHGSNWQKMVPRRFLLLCGLKKGDIHQTTKTTGFWITNSLLKFLGVKKGAFHVWMHVSYMYHVPKMIHNDACRIPLEVVAVVFSLSCYFLFRSPLWVDTTKTFEMNETTARQAKKFCIPTWLFQMILPADVCYF